ncbi:MAG TPA: Holliday junction branch migration protein RuvA [Melioribacteraceae bacterium]|nr:Holliday junction branch migration protein RuvA [Melioribacteraceae bacterium]
MIGYLKGNIINLAPTKLLLDVNGVGYNIFISLNTYNKLNSLQNPVAVFTHLSVRQDSMDLYGFYSASEKEMFELLISVTGIGPKLALGILSGIQTDELKNAVSMGNIGRIKAVPGIGKKTAERLILELKDKMFQIKDETTSTGFSKSFEIKADAVAALNMLGYSPKFTEKIIKQVLDDTPNISLEELIKLALSYLNKS